jgi:hypothetical protein
MDDEAIQKTLDRVAAEHGAVWVVADYRRGDESRRALVQGYLAKSSALADDLWFEYLRVRGYARSDVLPTPDWQPVRADYVEGPSITGWALAGGSSTAGHRIRLALHWSSTGLDEATAQAFGERKLFVHLLDSNGQRVGQSDDTLLRAAGEAPLRARSFVTYGDVAISPAAAAGPTRLAIGLYDPASGKRYSFTGGDTLELDGPSIAD